MDFKGIATQVEAEYTMYSLCQIKIEPSDLLWYARRINEKNNNAFDEELKRLEQRVDDAVRNAINNGIYGQSVVVRGGTGEIDKRIFSRFYKSLCSIMPDKYVTGDKEKMQGLKSTLKRMASKLGVNNLLQWYIVKNEGGKICFKSQVLSILKEYL